MRRNLWLSAATFLLGACGGHRPAGVPLDDRLNGEWELTLTTEPGMFGKEVSLAGKAVGNLALVLNRGGTKVARFDEAPQEVGTHNLRLDKVVPGLTPGVDLLMAAATISGDSVRLVLAPSSADPIICRGRWDGRGVAGEWIAHRRAGIDQGGKFTLKRPPP